MDLIPDSEFNPMFGRVTYSVDLKDCPSVNDINQRIKDKIKIDKKELKEGRAEKGTRYNISQLEKLQRRGFARRAINQAIAEPNGIVALTLQHGRKKAEKILLDRARKRLGPLRKPKKRKKRRRN